MRGTIMPKKLAKKTFPCPSAAERVDSMSVEQIRTFAPAFKSYAKTFKSLLDERENGEMITFRMIAEHKKVCADALNVVARTLPLIIEEEDAAKIFLIDCTLFFGNQYLQSRLTPENASLIYSLVPNDACPLGDFEFTKELVQKVLLEMDIDDAIEQVSGSYINYNDFDIAFLKQLAAKKNL